jgi:hypothetical protein
MGGRTLITMPHKGPDLHFKATSNRRRLLLHFFFVFPKKKIRYDNREMAHQIHNGKQFVDLLTGNFGFAKYQNINHAEHMNLCKQIPAILLQIHHIMSYLIHSSEFVQNLDSPVAGIFPTK